MHNTKEYHRVNHAETILQVELEKDEVEQQVARKVAQQHVRVGAEQLARLQAQQQSQQDIENWTEVHDHQFEELH